MKKTKLFIGIWLNCLCAIAQPQMKYWFIAPNKIKVQSNTVTVTPMGTPATAVNVANGFYDNSLTGNVLFYIAENTALQGVTTVYDYNNTPIGNIPNNGAEIIIVPFGNNSTSAPFCKRKFNIFSTAGGLTSPTGLYKTVLDMNSYSLATDQIDYYTFGTEFGAIAVGQPQPGTKDRYLYFLAGSGFNNPSGQIDLIVINDNGSVSLPSLVYPDPANNVPNIHAGVEVFSRELDLSPDGGWLAWASYEKINAAGLQKRYHYIKLNSSGDLDYATYGTNAYQPFNLGLQASWSNYYNYSYAGFRGVEFYQDGATTKLFVGAGNDGIYSVDITIPYVATQTPVQVTGSNPNYGFSQIEYAYNGNMYASSGALNIIGAFNPANPSPSIFSGQPSFPYTNPLSIDYSLPGNPNSTLFTLPDQIDGQDYSAIIPPVAPPVLTIGTYNFSSATQPTWTYGTTANNPWGATSSNVVHITQSLTISGNTHLTISGMTFKFSEYARLVIEQGSSLTLNNSILTSNYSSECNNYYTWQGVEVWGHINLSQNTTTLVQGKLTLNGSSRIDYAKKRMGDFQQKSFEILASFPDNIFKESLMQLVRFTTERDN